MPPQTVWIFFILWLNCNQSLNIISTIWHVSRVIFRKYCRIKRWRRAIGIQCTLCWICWCSLQCTIMVTLSCNISWKVDICTTMWHKNPILLENIIYWMENIQIKRCITQCMYVGIHVQYNCISYICITCVELQV